jgi:cytochrome c553
MAAKKTVKSASAKGSGKPKYKNVDEAYRKAQLKETKSAKERAKIKEAVRRRLIRSNAKSEEDYSQRISCKNF